MLEACADNAADRASVKFPFLDDGPLEVAHYKGFLCFGSPCPFWANDLAWLISINLAKRIPVANPVLSPTLVQPVLHCTWVYLLTSQSIIRVTNRALNFVFWIARFTPPEAGVPAGAPSSEEGQVY
eukprot:9234569-Pyramimonas_sp.AAC.1